MEKAEKLQLKQDLENVLEMPGWEAIKKAIENKKQDALSRLRTCDLDLVLKHRATADTCDFLFDFIKTAIEEGKAELYTED